MHLHQYNSLMIPEGDSQEGTPVHNNREGHPFNMGQRIVFAMRLIHHWLDDSACRQDTEIDVGLVVISGIGELSREDSDML